MNTAILPVTSYQFYHSYDLSAWNSQQHRSHENQLQSGSYLHISNIDSCGTCGQDSVGKVDPFICKENACVITSSHINKKPPSKSYILEDLIPYCEAIY